MPTSNMAVQLSTNAAQFKSQMALAGAAVFGFGKTVSGTLNTVEAAAMKFKAAAVGVGVAVLGVAAVSAKAAIELETAINNVATVWDEAGQKVEGTFLSLADASEQIIDLSTELPQSANQLAAALYDVASAGFQGTEAMTIMEVSARAASAGLTTTEVAVRGITAVLNAYGDGAGNASHVSDVLFQTVNLGVVTFEELSAVMGEFVGTAATAKVTIEEANAALATMTLAGISANEAATSLNRVMQEFIQPSEALSAMLQSLGHDTGVLALEERGLHGILTDIAQVVGGENVEAFAMLFPELRAMKGVLGLLAGDGENYGRVLEGLTNETLRYDATQRALDKQSKSTSYQLTVLKNTIQAISTEFGQALLPVIKPVVAALQGFVDAIQGAPDWLKHLVYGLAAVATALTVLLGLYVAARLQNILLQAALKYTGVQALITATSMKVLAASMPYIGIALAAISAAMVIFGKDTGTAKRETQELKDTLEETTGVVTEGTAAWMRDKIVKEGWNKSAAILGISSNDLTAALLLQPEALARVQAAIEAGDAAGKHWVGTGEDRILVDSEASVAAEKLGAAVEETTGKVKAATKATLADARAANTDKAAIEGLETAEQAEMKTAMARAEAHIAATAVLQEEINAAFSLADAYQAASDEVNKTDTSSSEAADRARTNRHEADRQALDDRLEAETRAADDRTKVRQDALNDQQEAEKRAFAAANQAHERAVEDRRRIEDDAVEASARARTDALNKQHEAESNALDERQQAEENALALVLRTQQNGYDDQARIRRQAHDDAMEELRDLNDKAIEAENEAWAIRQQEIQNRIDDTFGAERQAWQQTLADEEDLHEDRVDALEEAGDAQVRTEGNTFDDRERAREQAFTDEQDTQKAAHRALLDDQKDALRDRHDTEVRALSDDLAAIKTGIADRRRAEDRGWTDLVSLDATKMSERHEAQTTALVALLEAEGRHMTDRHDARLAALEKLQTAENDAADLRVSKSNEKHPVTLEALQVQIDKEIEQRAQMNRDLVKLAEQGGEDVNAATLAALAELGPEAVAAAAAGGPEAAAALFSSLQSGIDMQNIDPIKQALANKGKQIGTGLGEGIMSSMVGGTFGIVGNAIGQVSQLLNSLTPRANGGFFAPNWSGIFADGGIENHTAQIAPAGSWRLWAEPETGGEAYIPLALSKRQRSKSILAQTASMFGGVVSYADGGINGGGRGGGALVNIPIHVEVSAAVGADADQLARLVADKAATAVRAGFDALGRQVTVKAWRN